MVHNERASREEGSQFSGSSSKIAQAVGDLRSSSKPNEPALEDQPGDQGLSRELKGRHVQLITLGGAIGVGLFLGSARAIHQAGPALLVAYAISGALIFVVMRALGEMLVYRPAAGSFALYAEEFLGPWAGFVTGWSYWLNWVLVGIAEITAIALYFRYWVPDCPQWIPAAAALLGMFYLNTRAVKVFGEIEFWLALIKIAAIAALIIVGAGLIFVQVADNGHPAGLNGFTANGGVFPTGLIGLLLCLPVATFAFGGVEMIGATAGEVRDPSKTMRRAVNGVIFRIGFFYIGALAVIMLLVPWFQLDPDVSPFVSVFGAVGIPYAAGIMNLVILTAAISSCNSGMFTTGRMLQSLASSGKAPKKLIRLNHRNVPSRAVLFSTAGMSVGVVLNYFVPGHVFDFAISLVLTTALWAWSTILVSHVSFRRRVAQGVIDAPDCRKTGMPWANVLALLYIGVIIIAMLADPIGRLALAGFPAWFLAINIAYLLLRLNAKGKNRS
nr:amino acid permease [Sphingomonas sp. SCN 67-18]